jgi:hypothetical protein
VVIWQARDRIEGARAAQAVRGSRPFRSLVQLARCADSARGCADADDYALQSVNTKLTGCPKYNMVTAANTILYQYGALPFSITEQGAIRSCS